MSKMFKGKDAKTEVKTVDYPDYDRVRSPYSQWLSSQIGRDGARYTGDFAEKLTPTQQKGMVSLDEYASKRGTPELMELGAGELKKTLTGDYDPSKSVYYKALRESAKRNLAKTQKSIGDIAGGGGRYFSGARLKQQSEAYVDITNALNEILGQMSETERERRYQAAPVAANMASIIDALPATRAQNVLNIGELERSIGQYEKDKQYADWIKSKYEYPLAIASLAQNFQATKPPETYLERTPAQPSPFSQVMQSVVSPMMQGFGGRILGNFGNSTKTPVVPRGIPSSGGAYTTFNPSQWGKSIYGYGK